MSWFSDLLKDYPALNVAKERIALAEAKFASLETENAKLREEIASLRRENESLKRQLPSDDFVEAQGALFKRKPDGSFESIAYCPDCRRALAPFPVSGYFGPKCSKCGYEAPFKDHEIPEILKALQGQE